jgi:E1A/CREB-binding protein
MLDARELPKTQLSQFLEYYMGIVIEEERRGRALRQGVEPHQVPGCDQLSVRVVNNIIKKCEVKSRFQETFGSDHPQEFAYRQRVIVLFQVSA